jgi:hypothetical protein
MPLGAFQKAKISTAMEDHLEENRDVDRMLAVFDLTVREALDLTEDLSTRVMLVYDRERNVKEYTLLGNRLPETISRRLTRWLEENVDVQDIAFRLTANRLHADCFAKSRVAP